MIKMGGGGGGDYKQLTKKNPRSSNKTPKPLDKNLTLKESMLNFGASRAKGNSCDKKAVH